MTAKHTWLGLILLVVVAPLPFGANRVWAWSAISASVGLLLLVWCGLVEQKKLEVAWQGSFWLPFGLAGGTLAWIIIQAVVAVPPPFAHPLWQSAAGALGEDNPGTISVTPDAGLAGAIRLISYFAVFWLAVQFGHSTTNAWRFLRWFTLSSSAYALYGLGNYWSGNHFLLWFERWAYPHDLTSTFVNRNTYATFAALGVLSSLGLSLQYFRDNWRESDRSLSVGQRRLESFIGRPLIYFLIAIVLSTAWLQTHSRMGFAAGAVGLLSFLLLLVTGGIIRSRSVAFLMTVSAGLFILIVSGGGTIDRIIGTGKWDRVALFEVVTSAVNAAVWTGHGYGSFSNVFPMFRDLSLPTDIDYTEAHNTYLELALEIGVPGAAALVTAVLYLAAMCAAAVYQRRGSRIVPAVAAASSVIVGGHALMDFSLQIPAISWAFAALLGIGCGQSLQLSRAVPQTAVPRQSATGHISAAQELAAPCSRAKRGG